MKTIGTLLATAFALLPWCLSPVLAQQNASTGEKKIVITKRTVDTDGTETTETIVKKGKAAESFNVDQYVKENRGDNVQLDVQVMDGKDEDRTVIVQRSKNKNKDKNKEKHYNYNYNYNYNYDQGGKAMSWSSADDNGAFLGVEEDSDENPDQPGITVEVVRGSAADKAGLRTNDVILSLNGTAINEWDDLSALIEKAKPGDKMQIAYTRNGQAAKTEATLTKRDEVKCDPEACKHGFLGVDSSDEDDDEDSADDVAGVKVDIVDNSAAQKAGLQDGDLLLKLNDTEINDWEDITDFMSYTKPDEKVRITYQRDGKQSTTEASLGEPQAKSWNLNWEPKEFDIQVREKEACLGVYTSAYSEGEKRGTRISDFTSESAARESNMNTGDVITAVNGARVLGHDELWDQIAKYHPGDKVTIEYLRDNQALRVEATLKACRDNSNQVTIFHTDEGGDKRREFFLLDWDKKDQTRLSRHRVITIHRSEEGDGTKVETPAAPVNPATPDRTLKLDNFRAYPNPSQGQVTVEFSSEPLPTIVSLLDVTGRQLFREELNAFNGDYNQQFDLSEYAKGTIIIRVQQAEKVFTEQIIVN